MSNTSVVKILEMYKNGKITSDEAEVLLDSAINNKIEGDVATIPDTAWEDDGKLRIVAFAGKKMLKKGSKEYNKLEVKYDGPALNVDSYMSISCGTISGNVSASSYVTAANVGGYVSAGSHVTCGNVEGNVSAGSHVECGNIKGSVSAGSSVRCESMSK
ncbi:MAG: hypothetical protein A2Y17_09070 [Clostridiales bacterium GWF2_38_85]|nr:MAG: hypothetical protein A2Y17_09070 [Clostridiales bacterium GWF2_38_85]HBL83652.1 hypothetical protein [Clostridiales bacterium]